MVARQHGGQYGLDGPEMRDGVDLRPRSDKRSKAKIAAQWKKNRTVARDELT